MKDLFDTLGEESRNELRQRKQPDWTSPVLATLTDDPLSDEDWIFERKLDGERCLVFRRNGSVTLKKSRNKHALNDTRPEINEALNEQTFTISSPTARSSPSTGRSPASRGFSSGLESQIGRRRAAVVCPCTSISSTCSTWRDATSRASPLRYRKALLKRGLTLGNRIRYLPHRNEHGEKYLRGACDRGWEGLIAKRVDSPYGHRCSKDWLKLECVNQQEVIIGGYTDPKGSWARFGALLVGYLRKRRTEIRWQGRHGLQP
jgi:ATP-dependent DNA ligase